MRARPLLLCLSLLLLAPLASDLFAQTVVLVRHAEKADDGTSNPPLTAYGSARAEGLIALLSASGLKAAVTSPLMRTIDTAAPAVTHFGAVAHQVPVADGLDAHISGVAETVRTYGADDVVLVSGHSNTIPRIIGALGGPELPDLDESQYDFVFYLSLNGETPELRKVFYRPAE